jgi:hypothetical protein
VALNTNKINQSINQSIIHIKVRITIEGWKETTGFIRDLPIHRISRHKIECVSHDP